MILRLYVVTMVLAAGATYIWLVKEKAVPYTALFSAGWWGVLALQARDIQIYDQSNSPATVAVPSLQYMCAGAAVLSIAVIILWYFELFPVREQDEVFNPRNRQV